MTNKLMFVLIYLVCAVVMALGMGAAEGAQGGQMGDTTGADGTSMTESAWDEETGDGETTRDEIETPPADSTEEPVTAPETEPESEPIETEPIEEEKLVSVYLAGEGETVEMEEDVYLARVVMAEIPVSFPIEAIKAQAIAARTYLRYRAAHGEEHGEGEAMICTDYGCCMAYLDEEEAKERWGAVAGEEIFREIYAVVRETSGMVITYDGELISALFHSSSPGKTENAENVWHSAYPYLVSVSSPEAIETSEVRVGVNRLKELLSGYGERDGGGALWGQKVPVLSENSTGRVESLLFGGYRIKATVLRGLLGLKSTCFSVRGEGNEIVFSVKGYGHGVGMSQEGAGVLAERGWNCREILAHYYVGTRVEIKYN